MIKRWFLPDVVVAVFLGVFVIVFLDASTSAQSGVVPTIGAIWAFSGIVLIAYCGANWSKVLEQIGYVPFAFGVCSVFFGLSVALAPLDLLRDIIALTLLALVCMAVIVVVTWLRRLLTRKVWT